MTSESLTVSKICLKDVESSIKIPQNVKWIKANINSTGFFRVNYDKENWKQLKIQLETDHTVGCALPKRVHVFSRDPDYLPIFNFFKNDFVILTGLFSVYSMQNLF